jgi:hypothetical protein
MKRKKLSKEAVAKKYGFKSGLEERIANELTDKKVNFGYEEEKIAYTIPESLHKYTPDFKIKKSEGRILYVETKGRWVTADRKKLKLVKEQHPELDIRILFQNAKNKISKNSKTTYGDYADKIGIPWAEKTIPDSWFE